MPFDPSTFDFVRLQDFQFPGGVTVYEYANHPLIDGRPDFLRINTYLSRDGDFVTIWRGLLEPLFVESGLGFVEVPACFDFRESYTEELFKGWIDSSEAVAHILKTLRLDCVPPQVLSIGANGKLQCDPID